MPIKIDELKKAIQSTSNELDKLHNHLFDQMQFESQSIIGFNRHDKGFVLKIHIGEFQVSIAFDFHIGLTYQADDFTYEFKSPYCSIDDVRIYNRNSDDITDSIGISPDTYDSKGLIQFLNAITKLKEENSNA